MSFKKNKQIIIFLLIALILFALTSCYNQIKEEQVYLTQLGQMGEMTDSNSVYNIIDNDALGIHIIAIRKSNLPSILQNADNYNLVIDDTIIRFYENAFDNDIYELIITDDSLIKQIENSYIKTNIDTINELTKSTQDKIYLDSVVIVKDDKYDIQLRLYGSMRNAGVFVYDNNKQHIIPSYIKSSEDKYYTLSSFTSARNAAENNTIHNAFIILKNDPDAEQNISPSKVIVEERKIIIIPYPYRTLESLGNEGSLDNPNNVYNIINNTALGVYSVSFKKSRLSNELKSGNKDYSLIIGNTEYEFEQNKYNNDIYEKDIPDTKTISEIRYGMFEYYNLYALTLEANTDDKGTVSGGGIYREGTKVNITATPNEGYKFINWTKGSQVISTNANFQYTMPDENTTITANFEEGFLESYELKIIVTPVDSGQIKMNEEIGYFGKFEEGEEIKLEAIPSEDYNFLNWSINEEIISTEKEFIFKMLSQNTTITANFEDKPELSVLFNGNGGNPSSQIIKVKYGETINELPTVNKTGYNFIEWNSQQVGNGTPFTSSTVVTSNRTVYAQWEEISSNNSISGTIQINHVWSFSEVTSTGNKEELFDFDIKYTDRETINKAEYVPGQIIVGFHEVTTLSQRENVLNNINANILSDNQILSAYLLEVDETKDIQEEILNIQKMPHVRYAEPNYIYRALSTKTPNDPDYNYQWHYPLIRLPQAWKSTTGSNAIRVAVLDTGIDSTHPDLGANIDSASGYNFIDDNTNYLDVNGHGSHVAGTIGADTNNNYGVSGIMWNSSIIPVKVLNDEGSGPLWGIAEGVLYSAGLMTNPSLSQPAQIINMSLGSDFHSTTLENAINNAIGTGVIVVAATGNQNNNVLQYPARYSGVIAVGATDLNYPNAPQRAPYSNYGTGIDFVAPGGNVYADTDSDGYADGVLSTAEGGYYFYEGTSMAAPHVAGVAGLMLSNGIPANEVRGILQRTAMDFGTTSDFGTNSYNTYKGYGLINAYWAVNDVRYIDVLIGYWEGTTFYYIAEEILDLKDTSYSFSEIPEGRYQVLAHIDILKNDDFNYGDYFAISNEINFQKNINYTANLILEEIGGTILSNDIKLEDIRIIKVE